MWYYRSRCVGDVLMYMNICLERKKEKKLVADHEGRWWLVAQWLWWLQSDSLGSSVYGLSPSAASLLSFLLSLLAGCLPCINILL